MNFEAFAVSMARATWPSKAPATFTVRYLRQTSSGISDWSETYRTLHTSVEMAKQTVDDGDADEATITSEQFPNLDLHYSKDFDWWSL